MRPVALHVLHAPSLIEVPKIVFCTNLVLPVPLHSLHVVYSVPFAAPVPLQEEQLSNLFMLIVLVVPKAASSKEIDISTLYPRLFLFDFLQKFHQKQKINLKIYLKSHH